MSKNRGRGRSGNGERDEVEELLQAAQDDMLLKLSLSSHLTHSSDPLDQDLLRRFQALKTPASLPKTTIMPLVITPAPEPNQPPNISKQTTEPEDSELAKVLGADLTARFSALRASSSSGQVQLPSKRSDGVNCIDDDDDDEDDEVEKLMRWAMDAARLDPSKSDDDDEKEEDQSEEQEDSDDDEDDDKKMKPRRT